MKSIRGRGGLRVNRQTGKGSKTQFFANVLFIQLLSHSKASSVRAFRDLKGPGIFLEKPLLKRI